MKEATLEQHTQCPDTLGPIYTRLSDCKFHALFQSGLGDAGLHFCRTALRAAIHDAERRAKRGKSYRLSLRTSFGIGGLIASVVLSLVAVEDTTLPGQVIFPKMGSRAAWILCGDGI
jgi:hypothetical protein